MNGPRSKPFWKRKRWIAVAVVWLVAMYPLGAGPVTYAEYRGWLPREFAAAYRRPLYLTLSYGPRLLRDEFRDYVVRAKLRVPREKNPYWIYEWTHEVP